MAYNLGLALFYGLTAAAVFGAAAILYSAAAARDDAPRRSAVPAGLTATAAAVVLGNLAGGFQLLRDPGRLGTFDWWSPSRVIAGTANEFPAFSFLLGDLHAHVMATTFALVVVAYAIQLAVDGPPEWTTGAPKARAGAELALAALALGVLYPVNSLDFPTSCVIGCGALALWALDVHGRAHRALVWGGAWIAMSIVLFLPFWRAFHPPTFGIGLVRHHTSFSTFARDYLLIYGVALWVVLAMLVRRFRMPWRFALWGGAGALFVLVLLAPPRVTGVAVALVLAAAAVFAAFSSGEAASTTRVLWLLTAVALGLIAVGEVAYIRDAFDGTPSFRFNTVFKAGYQAWALLAVVTGVGVYWSASWLPRRVRQPWLGVFGMLVVLALVYPVLGPYSRLLRFKQTPTLDGMLGSSVAPLVTRRLSGGCARRWPVPRPSWKPWGRTSIPTVADGSRRSRGFPRSWAGRATRCNGATTPARGSPTSDGSTARVTCPSRDRCCGATTSATSSWGASSGRTTVRSRCGSSTAWERRCFAPDPRPSTCVDS